MIPNPSGCCGVVVDCCEGEVADHLTATIDSVSGCECADGQSIALAWDGQAWSGIKSICGQSWRLSLDCGGDLWALLLTDCDHQSLSPSVVQCEPLLLEFAGWELITCCAGSPSTVNIVVTE
jgi:hypothetical protein